MRVLFLTTCFPRPENQMMGPWALRQALALSRQAIDLKVVSFSPWMPRGLRNVYRGRGRGKLACPAEYNWDGLSVQYPRWPLYDVGRLKRQAFQNPWPQLRLGWRFAKPCLLNLVNNWRPDVVYAHHSAVNGYTAYRLRQVTGIPYVVTDHDFEEITECERYPRRKAFFEAIMGDSFQNVAVSSRMEADIRRIFPRARTMTIHNGADPIPDTILNRPRPAELNGKLVILSAANWSGRKCMPQLIAGFCNAAAGRPNAILRLAGSGQERQAVLRAVAASGCRDRIHVLGPLPHEKVVQEMVWADMFAMTGRDEPWGVAYLEAIAAGTPCVWGTDCGINDVLKDGVHGYAVAPCNAEAAASALRRLMDQPDTRLEMSRQATKLFSSGLTWDANAAQMVRVFERAVAGSIVVPSPNPGESPLKHPQTGSALF